ncbi:RNA-directed DNA polymerase, eukaryota, reverse transcriptase zinc-binding domain protein [Tanacetum coccineum]
MMDIIREYVFVPVNKELIPIRVYEINEDVSLLLNGYLMDSSSDEEDSLKGESCNNKNDDEEGNNDDLRDGNKENEDGNQHVETYGGFLACHQIEEGSTSLYGSKRSHFVPTTTFPNKNQNLTKRRKRFTSLRLCDLPMGGKRFTRMNNIGLKHSKIDRFLVSNHVVHLWPNTNVLALPREFSDHTPILLKTSAPDFGPTPFKLFNTWLEHHEFPELVRSSWNLPVTGLPTVNSLSNNGLCYDKDVMYFNRHRDRIQVTLTQIRIRSPYMENGSRINGLNIHGEWITEPLALKSHIFNSFHVRFKEDNHSRPLYSSNLFKQLSLEESLLLDSPFTPDEIKEAVWNCGSSKAPGPDGFTFKFFKKHWITLEQDILSYVKDFEASGSIPRGCNSSFITLVPKVEDPLVIGDFRPISLIGSQYKIIAKILANRLSRVLPSVVGEVQMAYIKGRQIIDGPLMVNEIIAWAKNHKKRFMFLKVDFEKAFDSLSWSFLFSILEQMGFSLFLQNKNIYYEDAREAYDHI